MVDIGEIVVVKVLCPGIEWVFCKDVDVFYFVVDFIEFVVLFFWCLCLYDVIEYFDGVVIGELDLCFESVLVSEFVLNIVNDLGF